MDEYKTVVSLLYWLSYKSICEILRGNMQIVWGGVAGVQGYIGGVQGEEGRGSLVGNSLQGADSNVKVAGFQRRPMATKLVVRIPNWLVVGEPDYQVSKTAKI